MERDYRYRPAHLTRREAILRIAAVLGGAAITGQAAMLAGCAPPARRAEVRAGEVAFLDEVAETLLPETDTPGARAAGVGAFMARMVVDTYDEHEQRLFREGMVAIDDQSLARHGADFLSSIPEQRLALLTDLDAEQVEYMKNRPPGAPAHYFRMMKELALLGYFTSEIGCRQARRYVETPGRYDPCVPWEPGQRAWARHA